MRYSSSLAKAEIFSTDRTTLAWYYWNWHFTQ